MAVVVGREGLTRKQVFLGLNEATGELLAVKEVDCSKAGESAIAELEAEIKLLQQLRHPNIVAYYGVQRDKGISVLVEYCAGGSIASVIATFGALNEQVGRGRRRGRGRKVAALK